MPMRKYGDVTLIDGAVVDSGSEAWRLECEARAVLAMPSITHRRNFLNGCKNMHTGRFDQGVLGRRGPAALAELQAKIMQVWNSRQGAV